MTSGVPANLSTGSSLHLLPIALLGFTMVVGLTILGSTACHSGINNLVDKNVGNCGWIVVSLILDIDMTVTLVELLKWVCSSSRTCRCWASWFPYITARDNCFSQSVWQTSFPILDITPIASNGPGSLSAPPNVTSFNRSVYHVGLSWVPPEGKQGLPLPGLKMTFGTFNTAWRWVRKLPVKPDTNTLRSGKR